MLFGEGKKGARQQKIDGSKMPDYEMVRHYLNPAGMQITSEKDGWFLKGFTLNMEAVKGEQTVQASQTQDRRRRSQTKPELAKRSGFRYAENAPAEAENAARSSRHPRNRQRRWKARLNARTASTSRIANRSKRKTARSKSVDGRDRTIIDAWRCIRKLSTSRLRSRACCVSLQSLPLALLNGTARDPDKSRLRPLNLFVIFPAGRRGCPTVTRRDAGGRRECGRLRGSCADRAGETVPWR